MLTGWLAGLRRTFSMVHGKGFTCRTALKTRTGLQTPQDQAGEELMAIYSLKDDTTPVLAAEGTAQKGRAKGWCQPGWYPPCKVVPTLYHPSLAAQDAGMQSLGMMCWDPRGPGRSLHLVCPTGRKPTEKQQQTVQIEAYTSHTAPRQQTPSEGFCNSCAL